MVKIHLLVLLLLVTPLSEAANNFGIVEPFPENIYPIEFTSAQVTCIAFDSSGEKTPERIQFMRRDLFARYSNITANDNLNFTSRTVYVDQDNKTLKKLFVTLDVRNVTLNDDSQYGKLGRYECHAFAVGDPFERKHGFSINVVLRSEIPGVAVTAASVLQHGDDIALVCNVTQSQGANTQLKRISWYKDSVLKQALRNPDPGNPRDAPEPLIIKNLNARDGGNYTCLLEVLLRNVKDHNVSDSTMIRIAPWLDKPKEDVELKKYKGNNVSFVCGAQGFPLQPVEWKFQKKGEDTVMSCINGSDGNHHISRSGIYAPYVLNVSDLQYTDSGLYYCCLPSNCSDNVVDDCQRFVLRVEVNKTTESAPGNSTSISIVVYISSGVAFILLLLVSVGIGLWCNKKIKRSARSRRKIIPLDNWEIIPEQIEYEEELGRGAFGVVHKATFRKRVGIEVLDNGKQTTWLQDPKEALQVVAVKVLQDDPTEVQKAKFMFEIAQMKLLGSHRNIVSLVGCYTLQEQKFLVIEYVPFGDLLKWLRRRRKLINKQQASEKCYDDREALNDQGGTRKCDQDDECKKTFDIELLTISSTSHRNSPTENLEEDDIEEEDGFSTQRLFSFAWQIAKGMNHLAENDFVHRDLAARNVLVGRDNQVKVSDFGLMRQIYEDVYSSQKTVKLPVKWMSPESLYEGIYTIKSDVWAYGVLLWEMATLGGVPYPTLTNTELYQLLNTGYRMERPDMCCDEVHELMTECWKEDPSTRPSFSLLIEKLEVIMQRDVPYCDLRRHDESSPYYNVPYGASANATDESKL